MCNAPAHPRQAANALCTSDLLNCCMVAMDVVCVGGPQGLHSTKFFVQFGFQKFNISCVTTDGVAACLANAVEITINGKINLNVPAIIDSHDFICFLDNGEFGSIPSKDVLTRLELQFGRNDCTCRHIEANISVEFAIWLYSCDDYLMVMDVDGTITKSDVRGYVASVYMGLFSYIHDGLVNFLQALVENSRCHVLYLTARPITHLPSTKKLLRGIHKNQTHLPDGPVIASEEGMLQAAYDELIARKTVEYKSGVLLSVVQLFEWAGRARESGCPFVLGIGNKATDAQAYDLAGIDMRRILLVNKSSRLMVWRGPSVRGQVQYLHTAQDQNRANCAVADASMQSRHSHIHSSYHTIVNPTSSSTASVSTINASSSWSSASSSTADQAPARIRFTSYKDPQLYLYVEHHIASHTNCWETDRGSILSYLPVAGSGSGGHEFVTDTYDPTLAECAARCVAYSGTDYLPVSSTGQPSSRSSSSSQTLAVEPIDRTLHDLHDLQDLQAVLSSGSAVVAYDCPCCMDNKLGCDECNHDNKIESNTTDDLTTAR